MAQIDLSTLPRTKAEARRLGAAHYFTGNKCKRGHTDKRYASNGSCFSCGQQENLRNHQAKSLAKAIEVKRMQVRCTVCQVSFTPEFGRGKRNKAATFCSSACRTAAGNASSRKWQKRNPDRAYAKMRRYQAKVRMEKGEAYEGVRATQRQCQRNRYKNNPGFVVKRRLCGRLRDAVRAQGGAKASSSYELVGCSHAQLLEHLSQQFSCGMNWENFGQWHIDHIRPCASFDLTDPEQQKACFHYTNLQPLWARDNLRKGASLAT